MSGEGNGNPLQYSCLENPMGRGAWWAAVHGVAKNRTRLRVFAFTLHFSCIPEGNGNPLQCLAWRIPGTAEPGGLPSMGVAQSQTQLKQLSSNSSKHDVISNTPIKNVGLPSFLKNETFLWFKLHGREKSSWTIACNPWIREQMLWIGGYISFRDPFLHLYLTHPLLTPSHLCHP